MNSLSTSDIELLTTKLKKQSDALKAIIDAPHSEDTDFSTLAGEVHDRADESIADLFGDTRIDSRHRAFKELNEVNEALLRIEDKTYGRCMDCGTEIGVARLEAFPVARRCISCKEKYEETILHSQSPSL